MVAGVRHHQGKCFTDFFSDLEGKSLRGWWGWAGLGWVGLGWVSVQCWFPPWGAATGGGGAHKTHTGSRCAREVRLCMSSTGTRAGTIVEECRGKGHPHCTFLLVWVCVNPFGFCWVFWDFCKWFFLAFFFLLWDFFLGRCEEGLLWAFKGSLCFGFVFHLLDCNGIDSEGVLQNAFDLHRAWPEAVLRVGDGLLSLPMFCVSGHLVGLEKSRRERKGHYDKMAWKSFNFLEKKRSLWFKNKT